MIPDLRARLRGVPWPVLLVWLLVIASVVSWRRGVIFDGGVDPFVIGKALVAATAAGLAFLLWRRAPHRRRVGGIALGLVATIIVISLLGAYVAGDVVPSAVLVVRILLLAGTILLVISVTPSITTLWTLLTAMGVVGLVAAVTGASSFAREGRLFGGIPPVAPNELATLVLPPTLGGVFYIVRRGLRWWMAVLVLAMMATTLATGSRTALAVLGLGVVLTLLAARPLTKGTAILVVAAVPAVYIVLGFTDIVSGLISRGEDLGRLLTLNSRTIAWEVVLSTPQDSWRWWIGAGLSLKKIAVEGQYWDEQVLDSSWISSLAQDGVIGTIALALLVVLTFVFAARSPVLRGLAVPIVLVIALRSFLENGLVESSATFTLFFTIAVLVEPGTRDELIPRVAPRGAVLVPEPRVLAYPAAWLRHGAEKVSHPTPSTR